jgi:hypothetical protein
VADRPQCGCGAQDEFDHAPGCSKATRQMVDQPYTEADVKALGEKLQAARTVLKRMDDGYLSSFQADGEELARVALDHLAGRLLPEGAAHLHRPFFYREKANGVTLAVTYQGSDGLAFVAQPHREATEPYEQYGVVLPRDVARALALRMLVSLQDQGSTDE